MSKFGHLKKERVTKDRTAEYALSRTYAGETPVLTVRPIGQALNPGYTNAFIRMRGGMRRVQAMQQRQLAAKDFSKIGNESRESDRKLFPEHVIVGWTGVVGETGEDIPFTKEDCRDFLESIDDYVFDELRGFCLDPANFVDLVPDEEARDLGND